VEQDTALQKQMEREGMYRFGGTYVDKAKKAELDETVKKVNEKMEGLKREYQRLNDKVAAYNVEIESRRRQMASMNSSRGQVDAFGRPYIMPLPQQYYDLEREANRLEAERDALVPKLEEFKGRALAVQQEMPQPTFTGKQQFIEVEGTPLGGTAKSEKAAG
jgi:predicted RNase H-like nuclease (RuvC/YqgF family)